MGKLRNPSRPGNFYPRSPCGERPWSASKLGGISEISIHALLAESDLIWRYLTPKALKFLSTLSLRRATLDELCRMMGIKHFYPRSPCGERQKNINRGSYHVNFYPRSPCGERHLADLRHWQVGQISIHALLAESDISYYNK